MSEPPPESPELISSIQGAGQWDEFENEVRTRNRFFPETASDYFSSLLEGCRKYEATLDRGSAYYRARIHPLEEGGSYEPLPLSELKAPPPNLCTPGRLNPEGIPYLYLASTPNTAVAEVRPWRDADVTVAEFTIPGEKAVVDLRLSTVEEPGASPVHWFAFMLSRPVHRDDRLRYVATQLVAERLKHEGFAGVLYGSSMDFMGHNLVLFDPSAAVAKERAWYQVHEVQYTITRMSE